ncbi:MAG: DUF4398 domain-containing protein [Bdellovibrionales bacterium]
MKVYLLLLLSFIFVGCAGTPPFEDYSFAEAALNAARSAEASQYSPGNWAKADEAYNLGEIAYRNRDYANASDLFRQAREFAEKAENVSRLKKFQLGGGQ